MESSQSTRAGHGRWVILKGVRTQSALAMCQMSCIAQFVASKGNIKYGARGGGYIITKHTGGWGGLSIGEALKGGFFVGMALCDSVVRGGGGL